MLLDFRKPSVVIEDSCVSWSGKYYGFYGVHYEAGLPCWVVGASNKENGEIIMRHYNTKTGQINEDSAKFHARQEWKKLKEGFLKAPISQETDDDTTLVSRWIDEFERQRKNIKHSLPN